MSFCSQVITQKYITRLFRSLLKILTMMWKEKKLKPQINVFDLPQSGKRHPSALYLVGIFSQTGFLFIAKWLKA